LFTHCGYQDLARLRSHEEGVFASLCLFVYPSVHPLVSAHLSMNKPSWHLGSCSTSVEKIKLNLIRTEMQQTFYTDFSMFHIFDSSAIQRRTYCFVSITTHLVFISRFAADLCSMIRVSLRAKIRTLDNVRLYAHCLSCCVTYLSDYTIPYCFKLFATRIVYYAHVDIELNSLLHSYIILPNWAICFKAYVHYFVTAVFILCKFCT